MHAVAIWEDLWLYREKGDVVWVEILGASGREVGETSSGGVESQVIYMLEGVLLSDLEEEEESRQQLERG